MNAIVITYAFVILLIGVMTARLGASWKSTIAYLLISLVVLAGMLYPLGRSRPIESIFTQMDFRIIAHKLVPGDAIYVWLDTPDGPLSIKLPWQKKRAEEIERERRLTRGKTRFRLNSIFNDGKYKIQPDPKYYGTSSKNRN